MNFNGEMPLPLIASLGAAGILIGAGKRNGSREH